MKKEETGQEMMRQEMAQQEIIQQEADDAQVTGLSLEETFGQIEEVIARLETEEITLEQSFQEYNRGMRLLRHCNETIDRVEKKVLQINEDGGLDEF